MGFSVSGAAAIIFVSGFIAFGMWSTAAANSFENVADAETDRADGALERQNTAIEIDAATWDGTDDELTVTVTNAGTAQLRLSTTDLLVDGAYQSGWASAGTVSGDGDTDLWLSGDQATITVPAPVQPDRVKVVTETGVAATAEVTQA